MGKSYFITGTGTGVGKTFVTTVLTRQLRARGGSVRAIKPIISGYYDGDKTSDSVLILASLDLPITPENIAKISPWRFAAPLSPDMAAKREGREIILDEVVGFCKENSRATDTLIIEGVGGVLVPLNDTHTVRDWIAEVDAEVIVVAGSYLGAINHTLCTIEALIAKNLPIKALIISESENPAAPLAEVAASIQKFIAKNLPIILLPRHNDGEIIPDISDIIV